MGVRYRARQFALALGARVNRERTDTPKEYLEAPQLELFHRMARVDQYHGLAVFRALREEGESETSLLQAALLHDVGKTMGPVRMWHRVVAVLVNALAPRLWERMDAEPGARLYPFFVHRKHAALGAELARRAGCSPEVMWLIAHHEDRPPKTLSGSRESELLAALQAADEVN